MKILILTNNFGGLYTFRREVVQALLDKGHEVMISAPIDVRTRFFQDMGCGIIDTAFNRKGKNPLMDIALAFRYIRILKRIKPGVVMSYTIKPNLYGGMACQLCGVPQIANITGLGTAVENPGWLQKLTIVLYKIGMRKTKMVFCQNKANMDFCIQHKMVKGNARLIPGSGVNLQHHSFQAYPSNDEPLRFIFISRLLREKGIEEYLAAAQEIKAKCPDIEFHILGSCEDDYVERIEKLHRDGVVVYHGKQADVRPFIGQSCCTVHPSFYPEGMSNVLLESCAAGRPVITTNRPGCGEIVDDTVNGFLVRQHDADDLVKKINQFIALPYEKKVDMGMKSRLKVEKEFDRKIVVDAYLKEINRLKE